MDGDPTKSQLICRFTQYASLQTVSAETAGELNIPSVPGDIRSRSCITDLASAAFPKNPRGGSSQAFLGKSALACTGALKGHVCSVLASWKNRTDMCFQIPCFAMQDHDQFLYTASYTDQNKCVMVINIYISN